MRRSQVAAARFVSRRALLLCGSASACVALLCARPNVATAQQKQPPLAEARKHFDRGLVLLDRGELVGAAVEFEAANTLIPAPLAAYDAALANARLGRPLAAVRLLRAVNKQQAAAVLQDKIAALLHEQTALLGTLLVRVTDEKGASIDDAELIAEGYGPAELRAGQPAEVDPGSMRLSIAAVGHLPIERTVVVAAGTRQELLVEIRNGDPAPPKANGVGADTNPPPPTMAAAGPSGSAVVTGAQVASAEPAVAVSPKRGRGAPTAGIITASVGAAVMLVGGAVWWDADRGFAALSSDVQAFNASTGQGGSCSRGNNVSACRSKSGDLNQRHANLNLQRIISAGVMGIGAVAVLSGAFLCLDMGKAGASTAAHPPLAIRLTWGSAILVGVF